MENIPGEQSIFDFVEDPNTVVKKKKKATFGTVIVNKLNVRTEPDPDSDICMVLTKNTVVTITSDNDPKYYGVFLNRISGYCLKEFIKIN